MIFRHFKKIGVALATTALLSTAVFSAFAAQKAGDVNNDGVVNINDATLIQKVLVNLETAPEDFDFLAETCADGRISVRDVTAIQMYNVKMIDSLPYFPGETPVTPPTQATEPSTEESTASTDEEGWNNQIIKP